MMPLAAKWWLTFAIVVLATWLTTVGRTKFRWMVNEGNWRGGRLDPTRWFLFEKNGDLRLGGLFAIYVVMLVLVWLT